MGSPTASCHAPRPAAHHTRIPPASITRACSRSTARISSRGDWWASQLGDAGNRGARIFFVAVNTTAQGSAYPPLRYACSMVRAVLVPWLLGLCLAGCSSSTRAPRAHTVVPRDPPLRLARLGERQPPQERLPGWLVEMCASFERGSPPCARTMPVVHSDEYIVERETATPRYRVSYLTIGQGPQSGGTPRPPAYAELVFARGDARTMASLGFVPARGSGVDRFREDLISTSRAHALNFGAVNWSGHRGDLILTSPSGLFRDILALVSQAGDDVTAVGLLAWDPLGEALRSLQSTVASEFDPGRASPPSRAGPSEGIGFERTPRWLEDVCVARIGLPGCPAVVPTPSASLTVLQLTPTVDAIGSERASTAQIDIAWGGESGSSRVDKPPRLVHLVLSDGDLPPSTDPASPNAPGITLGAGYPRSPIMLGHPSWTAGRTALSLGNCFENHVCYRWRLGDGRNRLISTHAWYPLSQTTAVLHRLVASVPGS